MKTASVTAICLSIVTGCYGAAPPKPSTIHLPDMSNGGEIVVASETKTTMETVTRTATSCPAGVAEGHPSCTVTRYPVVEPVTRTTSRASYNGERINFAQFQVMTDPQYDAKLAQLDDLSHKCKRANVPRYVGLSMVIGGLVLAGIGQSKESTAVVWTGWGTVLGGGVSYGFGYFGFGGRECNQARALYTQVEHGGDTGVDTVYGRATAEEMQDLAAQFNARMRPASAMKMR
jgi:hypothetical protein